jgi:hypothetical protein
VIRLANENRSPARTPSVVAMGSSSATWIGASPAADSGQAPWTSVARSRTPSSEHHQIANRARVLAGQRERVRDHGRDDLEVRLIDGLAQEGVDGIDPGGCLIGAHPDGDLDVGVLRRRRSDDAVETRLRDRRRVDRAGGEQ